jgi:hypothetical protein
VGEPKLSGQFFRETSQLPLIQKLGIGHQLLHTALQPLDLDRETEESSWREALQKLRARGVEFIKVHNALSQEAFFALADEVHKQGLPLCRALAQRDKTCGSFRRRLFARFLKNATWYLPTLIIIGGFSWERRCKRLRSAGPSNLKNIELVQAMHESGVQIMVGSDFSDWALVPGVDLHNELDLFR